MNEYLEQLVRVLTNAYIRCQECLVSVYHLAPQISEAFLVFLVAGGQMLLKQQPSIHLTDDALSLSLSACFYALASCYPSQRINDFSKRRGLIACVQTTTPTAKLLCPNHLRSLTAAPNSDLSARQYKGVIPGYDVRTSARQHVFRGCIRSYSATASLRHREGKLCGSCGRKTHPETV